MMKSVCLLFEKEWTCLNMIKNEKILESLIKDGLDIDKAIEIAFLFNHGIGTNLLLSHGAKIYDSTGKEIDSVTEIFNMKRVKLLSNSVKQFFVNYK